MLLWKHSCGSAPENSCSMEDLGKFHVKELIFKTQKLSKLDTIYISYLLSGMKVELLLGFKNIPLIFVSNLPLVVCSRINGNSFKSYK